VVLLDLCTELHRPPGSETPLGDVMAQLLSEDEGGMGGERGERGKKAAHCACDVVGCSGPWFGVLASN
jgi:hypothetical protein